jgi:DNA-binding transcriptional regulator PaaX
LTLQELGFVQITRGVYGGWRDLANQVEERVIDLQLSQEVLLIPFEQASFFKPKELSYKVLQLEDQTQACLKLINSFQRLLKVFDKRKELSLKQKKAIKLSITQTFFLLKRLPALPTSLAPAQWPVEALKEQLQLASKAISA